MKQVEVKRRQIQAVSYMIAMITLLILGRKVGDNGIAYIAVAVECYALVIALICGCIPDVLGRLLRGRNAKAQYKNVSKIKKKVFLWQCIFGLLGSVLLFACAVPLAKNVFLMRHSALLLMLLSPAVFFRSVSSVFLGCFQGEGTELPTAVSSVLRQIFILGFGILFCNILSGYGEKVSNLLGQETFTAMYGGAGLAVAVSLTEAMLVLFLFLVYKGSSRPDRVQQQEGRKTTESFGEVIKNLYGNLAFPILIRVLEILPLLMGIIFSQRSAETEGAVEGYGAYFGKYLFICGVVIVFLCAAMLTVSVKISSSLRRDEPRYAKNIFQSGVHILFVNSTFFAVYIAVMSDQLAATLCTSNITAVAELLRYGSAVILFLSFGFFFARILLQIGKKYIILGGLVLFNAVFVIGLTLFLNGGVNSILALDYAGLIALGSFCLVMGFFVFKILRTGIDVVKTFLIPAGAAGVTGLIGLFLGKACTPHLGAAVTLLVCMLVMVLVYWCILMLFRDFHEQELHDIPGGRLIRIIGEIFHTI